MEKTNLNLLIIHQAGPSAGSEEEKAEVVRKMHGAASIVVLILMVVSLSDPVVTEKVHASVKNRLGSGRNMKVHCQSKDNDLGEQVVTDGSEFGWDFSVNAWGTTLFYCDTEWEKVQGYHFDAYSFERDYVRCESQCAWLISEEGIYALNGITGFWEFFYGWSD